ncbi:MAG: hypothetical protein IJT54_04755 [Candidatus Methanomethylophilaceae archaeon]|nr:hypothetical protein [Candidatus Methanomethylophilaceae archaeon]
MRRSDEHLERALEEYNQKISELESNGSSREEMLEALVNRSTVLLMLESYTSSMEDSEDAIELSKLMESKGEPVNVGTYMKMYENHGQLLYDSDNDGMAEDYAKIVSKLDRTGGDIRHYDKRSLIVMCIDCAEDLIDVDKEENAIPFLQKAIEFIGGDLDKWSRNHKVHILNLLAEVGHSLGQDDGSLSNLEECIRLAGELMFSSSIDDPNELVNAYILRGDILESMGKLEGMWESHEAAAEILEKMYLEHKLDDVQLLINLHQGIATSMMNAGKIELAEKHLMRSINLGIPGMKEAMKELNDQFDL